MKSTDALQWAAAWDEYVRGSKQPDGTLVGNVPSGHARQLIQNFLTNTLGRAKENEEEDAEADPSDVDAEIPPLRLAPDEAQVLLCSALEEEVVEDASEEEPHGQ